MFIYLINWWREKIAVVRPWRSFVIPEEIWQKKKCLNQGCWQGGHSLLLFSEIHGNASSKGPSALYIFSVAVPFMPGLLFLIILSVFWKVIDVGCGGEACVWIGQAGSCALFSSPIFHLLSFFGANWFLFCTLWVIFLIKWFEVLDAELRRVTMRLVFFGKFNKVVHLALTWLCIGKLKWFPWCRFTVSMKFKLKLCRWWDWQRGLVRTFLARLYIKRVCVSKVKYKTKTKINYSTKFSRIHRVDIDFGRT